MFESVMRRSARARRYETIEEWDPKQRHIDFAKANNIELEVELKLFVGWLSSADTKDDFDIDETFSGWLRDVSDGERPGYGAVVTEARRLMSQYPGGPREQNQGN